MVASRGRSPPVPTLRNRVHSLQAASSAPTPPPAAPQLAVDFIPYIRTDEVLNQDPVDPADDPPALKHTGQTHAAPDTCSYASCYIVAAALEALFSQR